MRKPALFVLFAALIALLVLAVSCNPDSAAEKRLAGTWQRTKGDMTYQMILGTDGWATFKTFEKGVQEDSTEARWKVDGTRIVFTLGQLAEAETFSLEGDTLVLGDHTYTRV